MGRTALPRTALRTALARTALPGTTLDPTAQNVALFSLSRHIFHSFFPLLGVFSWNFGGVFEDRGPQMSTFGLSGCRVKPRRLWGRRAPHDTRELQTCTFQGPSLQKNKQPKFNKKTPRERDKKNDMGAGEEKQKERNLGGLAEGRPANQQPHQHQQQHNKNNKHNNKPPFGGPTPRGPPVEIEFGQSESGQNRVWPIRLWPKLKFLLCEKTCVNCSDF